jgi:tRNA(Ile)-lysidine synthase
LRGAESDQDERFARKLASDLKLKFFSKRVDVKNQAKKRKLTIEEAAREVRYGYLREVAKKVKADKIALGHQADDQAETFLMRLIRGAGARGLSGIPAKRGEIIRPLIQIRREDIEDFLKTNRIACRQDSSNYLTDFNRNKIRLKLLPIIRRQFNPRIVESLNRAADIISLQAEYVWERSQQTLDRIGTKEKGRITLDSRKFMRQHVCLQREMVRLCVSNLGGDADKLSFELVDRVLNLTRQGKSGRRVRLNKDLWFEAGGKQLAFYGEKRKTPEHSVRLPGRQILKYWGLRLESEILNHGARGTAIRQSNRNIAFFDWNKLKSPHALRARRKGDKFKPLGMKGTKSVADFLIDGKIPRHLRDQVPILTSQGRIVWLVGHRISDQFKVTAKTKQVLKIEAIRTDY